MRASSSRNGKENKPRLRIKIRDGRPYESALLVTYKFKVL